MSRMIVPVQRVHTLHVHRTAMVEMEEKGNVFALISPLSLSLSVSLSLSFLPGTRLYSLVNVLNSLLRIRSV